MPALQNRLVLANIIRNDFANELSAKGATVDVPLAPAMSSSLVGETGSVTTQNPTMGNVKISLDYHREASFEIPDVTKVLATPDLVDVYTGSAITALQEGVEGDIWSVLIPQLTTTTGAATAFDEARLDDAETALFNAKAPAGDRYFVASGATYGKIRQVPRFSEMLSYGNGVPIQKGEVLEVKGFPVFRTQLVPKPSTIRQNVALHRECAAIAFRPMPTIIPGTGAIAANVVSTQGNISLRVVMSYNPTTLSARFTLDLLYGIAVPRPMFGVIVQTND